MSSYELGVMLSPYAQELVNKGIATISTGGPRLADGTLVELYRPVLMKAASNASRSAIRLIGMTNPYGVAADVIGHIANAGLSAATLYVSKQNSKKLDAVIKSISSLKNLTWMGTALGAPNLAMTVVSFAVISKQLTDLSGKIDRMTVDLKDEMRLIQKEEHIEKIHVLLQNINSIIGFLERNEISKTQILQIEPYLNEANESIQWLSKQFIVSNTKNQAEWFALLFDLTALYASVLKEYGAQHYYLIGCYPKQYDHWLEAFRFCDDPALRTALKKTVWIANPVADTSELEAAYDLAINTVELQAYDLREYREFIHEMPKEAHFDLTSYIDQHLSDMDFRIEEDEMLDNEKEAIFFRENAFWAA